MRLQETGGKPGLRLDINFKRGSECPPSPLPPLNAPQICMYSRLLRCCAMMWFYVHISDALVHCEMTGVST